MKNCLRITFLVLIVSAVRAQGQTVSVSVPIPVNGKFVGRVVAEWLKDGRLMKLTEPFAYIDPAGQRWDAPAGSIVDGASIPQIAWSFTGGPFEGKYRDASVIHDVACVQHQRDWQQVHLAFYTAMLASGVERLKAKIMYGAVYQFGPRWPTVREITQSVVSITGHNLCTNMPAGPPVCINIPIAENRSIEGDVHVRIEVPPPMPTLQEKDFQRLVAEIERMERSDEGAMTLEQIRNYK